MLGGWGDENEVLIVRDTKMSETGERALLRDSRTGEGICTLLSVWKTIILTRSQSVVAIQANMGMNLDRCPVEYTRGMAAGHFPMALVRRFNILCLFFYVFCFACVLCSYSTARHCFGRNGVQQKPSLPSIVRMAQKIGKSIPETKKICRNSKFGVQI